MKFSSLYEYLLSFCLLNRVILYFSIALFYNMITFAIKTLSELAKTHFVGTKSMNSLFYK